MRKFCQKKGGPCTGSCTGSFKSKSHGKSGMFQRDNWYRPESLKELTELLGSFQKGTKYRLVAGNTGTGNGSCDLIKYLTKYHFYQEYLKMMSLTTVTLTLRLLRSSIRRHHQLLLRLAVQFLWPTWWNCWSLPEEPILIIGMVPFWQNILEKLEVFQFEM